MKNKSRATAIGVFVMFAIIIFIAAVVVFGSGKLFSPSFKYVAYFDGRLKGLKVGSRVMFRGVTIGSVEEITINIDGQHDSMNIPVIFDIELDKISNASSQFRNVFQARAAIEELIQDKGLRARLSIDSLVTGQLVIELDFDKDAELRLVDPQGSQYPEFPTVQSTVEQFAESFKEIPIKEMSTRLNNVIAGLDKRINDPELEKAMKALGDLMAQYTALARNLNESTIPKLNRTLENVSQLSGALRDESLVKLNSNLENADIVMANLNTALPELLEQIKMVRGTFTGLSKAATAAFANMENISDENSALMTDFRAMLKDFAQAARTIGQTADFLQRHPEALLQGKELSDGY